MSFAYPSYADYAAVKIQKLIRGTLARKKLLASSEGYSSIINRRKLDVHGFFSDIFDIVTIKISRNKMIISQSVFIKPVVSYIVLSFHSTFSKPTTDILYDCIEPITDIEVKSLYADVMTIKENEIKQETHTKFLNINPDVTKESNISDTEGVNANKIPPTNDEQLKIDKNATKTNEKTEVPIKDNESKLVKGILNRESCSSLSYQVSSDVLEAFYKPALDMSTNIYKEPSKFLKKDEKSFKNNPNIIESQYLKPNSGFSRFPSAEKMNSPVFTENSLQVNLKQLKESKTQPFTQKIKTQAPVQLSIDSSKLNTSLIPSQKDKKFSTSPTKLLPSLNKSLKLSNKLETNKNPEIRNKSTLDTNKSKNIINSTFIDRSNAQLLKETNISFKSHSKNSHNVTQIKKNLKNHKKYISNAYESEKNLEMIYKNPYDLELNQKLLKKYFKIKVQVATTSLSLPKLKIVKIQKHNIKNN